MALARTHKGALLPPHPPLRPLAAWRNVLTTGLLYPFLDTLRRCDSTKVQARREGYAVGPQLDSVSRQRPPMFEPKRSSPTNVSSCSHWFRVTLNLPDKWVQADPERIQFEWDPSSEAMIFDTEGLSLQAVTGGYGGDRRVDFILDPKKRSSTYKVRSSF